MYVLLAMCVCVCMSVYVACTRVLGVYMYVTNLSTVLTTSQNFAIRGGSSSPGKSCASRVL